MMNIGIVAIVCFIIVVVIMAIIIIIISRRNTKNNIEHESQGGGPPEIIYIIRHGEKPATSGSPFGVDFNGNNNNNSLLPRGWQRSGALTALFDPTNGSLQKGLHVPTSLFSPLYGDSTKTITHRTYQTIQGLSERLGKPINSTVSVGNESQLVTNVLNNYSDVVLICWEHNHIPLIASAIPTVSGTIIPKTWPNNRFDVIWVFTIVQGSNPIKYNFTQIPQQLLSGDTNTVI